MGGYLIINLPLSTGIFFRIANLMSKFGMKEALVRMWQFRFFTPHLYYFNKENLILLAKQYGFELECSNGLETLDVNNIQQRLQTDSTVKFAKIKATLIRVACPILLKASKDTSVFIFKKVK